tara:strand:- start:2824 stop:3162 length:339 start_codon:yes stop_codon:yes gene_type:complete
MKYLETGKLNSGINNFTPINSRPSTPSLTPNQPTSPPADFKPHFMYNSKGQAFMANTYNDHLKYESLGYVHEKPLTQQKPLTQENTSPSATDDGNLLFWVLVGMFALGILRG